MNEDSILSKLVYSGGEVWIAVGTSTSGNMIGSEAVLGLPQINTVKKVYLQGKSVSGVVDAPSSKQTLSDKSITTTNGVSVLMYSKLLDEPGEIPLSTEGSTILLFAIGASTQLGLHTKRVAVSIDLNQCVGNKSNSNNNGNNGGEPVVIVGPDNEEISSTAVVVHASLIIAAWMYFIPSGILIAVFKKSIGESRWLKIHILFQSLAIASMIAAVVTIVVAIDDADGEHLKDNETKFGIHTILGVEALSVAGLQLLIGLFRPHKNEPGQTKALRRKLFEIVHTGLGHVALVLGLFAVLSGVEQAYMFNYITSQDDYHWAALVPFSVYFVMLCVALTLRLYRDAKAARSADILRRIETSHSLYLSSTNTPASRDSTNIAIMDESRTPFLAMYILASLLVVGMNGSDDD